ncbi:Protein FEV, partial [Oryzias melastigma]
MRLDRGGKLMFNMYLSDPTENLLKESKGASWGPLNTGVQKGVPAVHHRAGHLQVPGELLPDPVLRDLQTEPRGPRCGALRLLLLARLGPGGAVPQPQPAARGALRHRVPDPHQLRQQHQQPEQHQQPLQLSARGSARSTGRRTGS